MHRRQLKRLFPKNSLRQMKRELAGLDPNSARFKELSQQAGILQDKIGDVAWKFETLPRYPKY